MFNFLTVDEARKHLPAILVTLYNTKKNSTPAPYDTLFIRGAGGCILGYDHERPTVEQLASVRYCVVGDNNVTWPGTLISLGKLVTNKQGQDDLLESKISFLST